MVPEMLRAHMRRDANTRGGSRLACATENATSAPVPARDAATMVHGTCSLATRANRFINEKRTQLTVIHANALVVSDSLADPSSFTATSKLVERGENLPFCEPSRKTVVPLEAQMLRV